MAFTKLYQFAFAVVAVSSCAVSVDCLPLGNSGSNVVYTRYVRHRPIKYTYADAEQVKEYVEVFHTRRRPPPFMFLNDEDLTRFVRCGYDPLLPGCEEARVSTTVRPCIESETDCKQSEESATTRSEDPEQELIETTEATTVASTISEEHKAFMDSLNYEDDNETGDDYHEGAEEEDGMAIEPVDQNDNYITDNEDNAETEANENANEEA